ncbi:hypothetical protein BBta_4705 [Bradyrhizobium sp. BTAi1]|nr:hypothetical protein BBta_4705 [Bradyrhizobium sp. BTAi1]
MVPDRMSRWATRLAAFDIQPSCARPAVFDWARSPLGRRTCGYFSPRHTFYCGTAACDIAALAILATYR